MLQIAIPAKQIIIMNNHGEDSITPALHSAYLGLPGFSLSRWPQSVDSSGLPLSSCIGTWTPEHTITSNKIILSDDDRTLEAFGFSEDKLLILMINQGYHSLRILFWVMLTALTLQARVSPVTAGPSNHPAALVLNSIQSSTPSSAVLHCPQATQKAQIVRVDSEGNNKLLATLDWSEVDDFEKLKAMGFPQQATVEAYLLCDEN
ncbi:hypothetical protein K435DRAFT_805979 [Dendrothele bispora CBS 962.96]|uniref:UBA domain-containing protein n=1 Tax=Dendrothele bispora (strain CBS 962.96) TaxID=1314807 RepID=A0A4S8LA03_DENBC|nr:hypothetical protein K435DRAFT_805979 [Dendrothele bispora CBS 962.96]